MQYFDIIRGGDVIGYGCRVRQGCTVSVEIGGEEHRCDFFHKNRYDLKMAVGFWISQIEKGLDGENVADNAPAPKCEGN